MSNNQGSASRELSANGGLNEGIGGVVDLIWKRTSAHQRIIPLKVQQSVQATRTIEKNKSTLRHAPNSLHGAKFPS
jgi:hypothetical protein